MPSSAHENGVKLASQWLEEHGLAPREEHWFYFLDKWGNKHKIRADVTGLSTKGDPLLVVEVGGVGSSWHFALSQEIVCFHLPLIPIIPPPPKSYLIDDPIMNRDGSIAANHTRLVYPEGRKLDFPPHPFGFCEGCFLTVPREIYSLEQEE